MKAVHAGHGGSFALPPRGTNRSLYTDDNPLSLVPFERKVSLLAEIDAYVRAKEPARAPGHGLALRRLAGGADLRPDGTRVGDIRPLVRLGINVVVARATARRPAATAPAAAPAMTSISIPDWKPAADEALRQALVNLGSVSAPAGEMPVVLGRAGQASCCTKPSATASRAISIARRPRPSPASWASAIAAKGVTVVDDGTIADRRGSLTVDDEGTPTQCTTLIEDGILVGYMQDRQNARLMGMKPTGNGRRESFAHAPMPRMTNTYHVGAATTRPEEIIKSVKKGLYAVNFGGGQVDITSGKFVFSCTEAYMIEDGKIGPP